MSSPVAAAARCRAVPCSFCGGSPYRARETEPCTCSLERSSSRSVPVVGQNSVATLDSSRQRSEAGRQLPLVFALLGALSAALGARSDLVLENLALRQQLALLRRRAKRPRFGQLDRLFWMWLSQRWARWREALHVVQPQTVIRWHRQGFRAFWNRKSRRGRTGRPPVDCEVAKLVRTMALANPLWGAPRIHGELLKLGLDVSQRTVGRLMPRRSKPPSRTWRAFLQNHLADLVSVDFFVVPMVTFRVLYVFVVLLHYRRKVVHFNEHDVAGSARAELCRAHAGEWRWWRWRRSFAIEHSRSRRIGCIRRRVAVVTTSSSRAHVEVRDHRLWKGVVPSGMSSSNAPLLRAQLVSRSVAPKGVKDSRQLSCEGDRGDALASALCNLCCPEL